MCFHWPLDLKRKPLGAAFGGDEDVRFQAGVALNHAGRFGSGLAAVHHLFDAAGQRGVGDAFVLVEGVHDFLR